MSWRFIGMFSSFSLRSFAFDCLDSPMASVGLFSRPLKLDLELESDSLFLREYYQKIINSAINKRKLFTAVITEPLWLCLFSGINFILLILFMNKHFISKFFSWNPDISIKFISFMSLAYLSSIRETEIPRLIHSSILHFNQSSEMHCIGFPHLQNWVPAPQENSRALRTINPRPLPEQDNLHARKCISDSFTLRGMWSWWRFSFWLWTQRSFFWFKIKQKISN